MQTLKFSPTSCLFSLFTSCCHFWRDFQKFFLPFFHHSLPREGVTSIGPISLDSLKEFDKKFVKQQAISVTLFTVTNIHSMQKSTTNNQKLGNKMTEISRVKRERESEMISEKFRGKRKGKVFKEEIG